MQKNYGYTGKILQIDLSSGNTSHLSTFDYVDRFLGGRGLAAKLYWDKVSPETEAFAPENRMILATGPLAGYPGLASSRWQVCGKSAAMTPNHFSYCNLGGKWGVELKFAGYDAVVIDGCADRPVYIHIKDDIVDIRDASQLWGQGAIEVRGNIKEKLGKSVKVLATGQAGENLVVYASLTADNDSSGSSGFGAVMGSKNLKAVVVQGSKRRELKAADPGKLEQLKKYLLKIYKVDEPWQPWATTKFTGTKVTRKPCWGCIKGCMRGDFKSRNGDSGKFMCQSGIFYRMAAKGNYERPTIEVGYYANKLCDDYGLDTYVVEAAIRWLSKCYQAGILNDSDTGLPLSKLGSAEFIEALIRTISLRQGFGDVLAQGLTKAAEQVGQGSEGFLDGLVSRADEKITYEPRMYISTGLLYAMEPRRPIQLIHQIAEPLGQWLLCKVLKEGYFGTDVLRAVGKRFFGSELVFDFSTYEGKALAVKMIQDREYAKESLILCDFIWPIHQRDDVDDFVGDPSLESQILSAVTGMDVDEKGLYRIGERVWNLQRAILVNEGHNSRQSDTLPDYFFDIPLEQVPENPKCLAPGKDGETISRQGQVVDRKKFEAMKDEYYLLRGWDDTSGLQNKSKLDELDLGDIAANLASKGLTAETKRVEERILDSN